MHVFRWERALDSIAEVLSHQLSGDLSALKSNVAAQLERTFGANADYRELVIHYVLDRARDIARERTRREERAATQEMVNRVETYDIAPQDAIEEEPTESEACRARRTKLEQTQIAIEALGATRRLRLNAVKRAWDEAVSSRSEQFAREIRKHAKMKNYYDYSTDDNPMHDRIGWLVVRVDSLEWNTRNSDGIPDARELNRILGQSAVSFIHLACDHHTHRDRWVKRDGMPATRLRNIEVDGLARDCEECTARQRAAEEREELERERIERAFNCTDPIVVQSPDREDNNALFYTRDRGETFQAVTDEQLAVLREFDWVNLVSAWSGVYALEPLRVSSAYMRLAFSQWKLVQQRARDLTVEWTSELLAAEIAMPDGTRTTYGEATVEQHRKRYGMLIKLSTANAHAAAIHQRAMNELNDAGVETLNQLTQTHAASLEIEDVA